MGWKLVVVWSIFKFVLFNILGLFLFILGLGWGDGDFDFYGVRVGLRLLFGILMLDVCIRLVDFDSCCLDEEK